MRRPTGSRSRRHGWRAAPARALALAAALAALAATGPATAADAPAGAGVVVPQRLDEDRAVAAVVATPRVARWLDRYPPGPSTDAEYDEAKGRWHVRIWSGAAGQVVDAAVDDRSGRVLEAWTGPQVAWKMARGRPGAFGGRTLTSWPVWVGLTALFLVGLADLRRLRAVRNLDLLVLASFGVSLGFFNRGEVFRSVALAVPPLVYLLARTAWIGLRSRPPRPARPVWPTWLLVAATLFLLGLRLGLNVDTPRSVIDVGYAGVIGAARIVDGRTPYGTMPQRGDLPPCGPQDAAGEVRDRIQPGGRCESANPRGDTYGPVAYLAYVPAVVALGWSGRWDELWAAHATSIALDLLVVAGLVLVGLRHGGGRLAATLAFAWAAFPFTAYALLANTNDALMPALLVWGFWLASSPVARGALSALAGWAKFASLLTVPLWLTYPDGPTRRSVARFAAAFGVATAAAFTVLLLDPPLADSVRTFWERTIDFQLGRESPFSIWGWGQYHAAGLPDLAAGQLLAQGLAVVLAGVAAAVPRHKGPLELAALTAAILLAVQLALSHWFYLYLPWVLPFVVLALLLPGRDSRADG